MGPSRPTTGPNKLAKRILFNFKSDIIWKINILAERFLINLSGIFLCKCWTKLYVYSILFKIGVPHGAFFRADLERYPIGRDRGRKTRNTYLESPWKIMIFNMLFLQNTSRLLTCGSWYCGRLNGRWRGCHSRQYNIGNN